MDPLYVLKLKCCYLEELLEDKYDVDKVDLLKEIADLKSKLKTNGLKQIKEELNEYIYDIEDDSEWLNMLKNKLQVNSVISVEPPLSNESFSYANSATSKKVDHTNSLQAELEEAKIYIKELEDLQYQGKLEKEQIEEMFLENHELKSKNHELRNELDMHNNFFNEPASPLFNKGIDESLLQETSILKSPVLGPMRTEYHHEATVDTIHVLERLSQVLNHSQSPAVLDEFKNDQSVYKLLLSIYATTSSSTAIRELQNKLKLADDVASEANKLAKQATAKLSVIKQDVGQGSSDYLNFQEKVKLWKIEVMKAIAEKDAAIRDLQSTISTLKQETDRLHSELEEQQHRQVVTDKDLSLDITNAQDAVSNQQQMILKLEKDAQMFSMDNQRLKKANDTMNQRFTNLVQNAEKLKSKMDKYEGESISLAQQLRQVEQEKEQLATTFELLKERLQEKLGDSLINDENIVEKYDQQILNTEQFLSNLEAKNADLQLQISQLEQELDVAHGKTEAEVLRMNKMNELLEQKERIVTVLFKY